MKKYNEEHEWVELDGDSAVIGISGYAAEQLGDLVYVELPEVGREIGTGENIVVLESVKTASEVCAPCAGKIIAINDTLGDDPELVSREPEGEGWLLKMQVSDPAPLESLMDQAAYEEFTRQ